MICKLYPLLIIFTFFAFLAQAQPDRPANETIAGHPRLLLLKGVENNLLNAIQQDRKKEKIHRQILKECDEITGKKPVKRIKVGMRLLDKSREAMLRIFYLSYSWRMTGNRQHLERAKQELEAIATFSDWNPSHFLDVAEMTIAAAIGYDWLYQELSPEQRAVVKRAIIEKGIEPSLNPKFNWWLKASHNWNQVCNAGMVFGALAVYEDSSALSRTIIDRSSESIKQAMKDYEPDGSYPEGYMYWGYGTTFNVLFISVLEKAFAKDFDLSQNPGFLSTPVYMQNMTGPSGDSFNFSDSDTKGVLQPAMFWFAQKTKNPSLLWVEKSYMEDDLQTYIRADLRLLPLVLIWGMNINTQDVPFPKNKIWTGRGKTPVALMRSSWIAPESIYVGFKGGSPSTNHSHMDIGSFIMEAGNVRWALDFGRQDYESLESKKINIWEFGQESGRWKVFRYNNFSHNTLSVNEQLQNVKGNAPLLSFSNNPAFINSIMDLSSLYPDLNEAKRGIAIVDESLVAVRDEYRAGNGDCQIRWSMLTAADVKLIGNREAQLTQGGKKLILKVLGGGDVKMRTWSTKSDNEFDADNSGTVLVGFETKLKAKKTGGHTVMLLLESASGSEKKRIPRLASWESVGN
jgi:hypothetical protein